MIERVIHAAAETTLCCFLKKTELIPNGKEILVMETFLKVLNQ